MGKKILKRIQQRLKIFNKATEDLEFKVQEATRINERTEMVMQYRAMKNCLHFRGIEKQDDEQIRP